MKKHSQTKSAVVIGASMAGLFTARVLSNHFEKVYLVERDPIVDQAEPRKSQPQAHHAHLLLAKGLDIMISYFPNLLDILRSSGAIICDPGQNMVWNCYGDYRKPFSLGKQNVFVSRPFLEWRIRQQVMNLKNLEVISGNAVDHLVTDQNRQQVTGVKVITPLNNKNSITIESDLVVDTTGRGSRSGKWLEQLGYQKPNESKVSCGTGYTTRIYRRNPEVSGATKWVAITPDAPKEQRGGAALPVEDDRWVVSLTGWHGNHAPNNEADFQNFAKSLPAPDIYNIISHNKPLSEFFVHKFPSSFRRHYEKLTRFPQGYLVLGDAVCSFNPVYGQGMTSAILQSAALDNLLKERKGVLKNIAKPYFRRIAKVIDIPWQTAVGEDFRYPQTIGKKRLGTDLINLYLSYVHHTTHSDPVVCKVLIEVLNLIAPPRYLFKPEIIGRVFRNALWQHWPKSEPVRQLENGQPIEKV